MARWREALFSKTKFIHLQLEGERRLQPAAGTVSQTSLTMGLRAPVPTPGLRRGTRFSGSTRRGCGVILRGLGFPWP